MLSLSESVAIRLHLTGHSPFEKPTKLRKDIGSEVLVGNGG
jgi:hypothetical protein